MYKNPLGSGRLGPILGCLGPARPVRIPRHLFVPSEQPRCYMLKTSTLTSSIIEANGPVLQCTGLIPCELQARDSPLECQSFKRLATIVRRVHPGGMVPVANLSRRFTIGGVTPHTDAQASYIPYSAAQRSPPVYYPQSSIP
jgi:hypothetical protein